MRRALRMRCPRARAGFGGLLAALSLGACEGGGDGVGGLRVISELIAPNCTPLAGSFPSGLAVLSGTPARAAVVTTQPPGVAVLGLESARPDAQVFQNVTPDSDRDGRDDAKRNATIHGFPLGPVMGEIALLDDATALVSTTSYEQLLLVDPRSAQPISAVVETPAAFAPGAYPLLPPPGQSELRTGLSTLACILPPEPFDSNGAPVGSEPLCDASQPSYLTTLTAGKARAAGRLFVATSNLGFGSQLRFLPGTVLVYQWDDSGALLTLRPDPDVPQIFTANFNPTGVTRIVTPGGRELVLVTVTGAIGSGSGDANVSSEASIEVIDPAVPRLAAVIPLGFAGPSFDAPSVDDGGRIAWVGASSHLRAYAVDLRALDVPALYPPSGPPIVLDGLTVGFPDARIFHADAPLALPDRHVAPSCAGFTHTALDADGDELLVSDFCDGTLTRVRQDLSGSPPIPFPRSRFQVASQAAPYARLDAIGSLRAPGVLRVRSGRPGVDYRGPDVFSVAGLPEAQLCALRVQSLAGP